MHIRFFSQRCSDATEQCDVAFLLFHNISLISQHRLARSTHSVVNDLGVFDSFFVFWFRESIACAMASCGKEEGWELKNARVGCRLLLHAKCTDILISFKPQDQRHRICLCFFSSWLLQSIVLFRVSLYK